MIIKSLSRKDKSFRGLYNYICRDGDYDPEYTYVHGVMNDDKEALIREFELNSDKLRKVKNSNYLYHEIVSITRTKGVSEAEQKRILLEAVEKYVKERSPNNLVFAGLHQEKDNNIHMHLMISANEVNKDKRYRLTKKQYGDAKSNTEAYIRKEYPEIKQEKLISKKSTYRDDKEALIEDLKYELHNAKTIEGFHRNLKKRGYEIKVTRGVYSCVIKKTKKAHRLKTIGLWDQYSRVIGKLEPEKKKESQQDKGGSKRKNTSYDNAKGTKEKVGKVGDEWIRGDFKQRDKEANKEKWKKQNKADAKVKDTKDQTVYEQGEELLAEWLSGDFSAREARERKDKSKKRLDEYEKKKKSKEHVKKPVKDRDDMSFNEKAKEATREWVFGDFSSREERVRKDKRYNYQTDPVKIQRVKTVVETELKRSYQQKNQTMPHLIKSLKEKNLRAYGFGNDEEGLTEIKGVYDRENRAYSINKMGLKGHHESLKKAALEQSKAANVERMQERNLKDIEKLEKDLKEKKKEKTKSKTKSK